MTPEVPVEGEELKARNRRVARVLLAIMAALATAGLLAGIRW
jgi:hypothetical protein